MRTDSSPYQFAQLHKYAHGNTTASHNTMSGVGGYDGASSSRDAALHDYFAFKASTAGQYDETVQTCGLCGWSLGGVDLVIHTHIDHRLAQSDICPCKDCYTDMMARALLANPQTPPRATVAATAVNVHPTPPPFPHTTGFTATPQPTQMLTPRRAAMAASVANAHLRLPPLLNATGFTATPQPLQMPTPPRAVIAASATNAHLQTPPLTHATGFAATPRPQQMPPPQTPPRAVIAAAAAAANTDPRPPSFVHAPGFPATPQRAQMPTPPINEKPVGRTQAVGLAHSEQQAVATHPPARPRAVRVRRAATPADKLIAVPNDIVFFSAESDVHEKNLPYEMSLIEYGILHRDASGRVSWTSKTSQPPTWLDEHNKPVLSSHTKNPMKWLPFLPNKIPKDVLGWQLTLWHRQAAAQGLHFKHSDLLDRMPESESQSVLSARLALHQKKAGILSQSIRMISNWPNKQTMSAVSGLTYLQLKFNTWWDVEYEPYSGVWIARQPNQHDAYRTPAAKPAGNVATHDMPWYIIQNPEERQFSEEVRLLDDAKLFLEIKASECEIPSSFEGVMAWFSESSTDLKTKKLNFDILLEFKRWRQGCPDSLSISCLRAALEGAASHEEYAAIKRADYSHTSWLQDLTAGLEPMRALRREEDKRLGAKFMKKGAGRIDRSSGEAAARASVTPS